MSACPTSEGSVPTRNHDIKGSILLSSMVVVLCHGRVSSSPSRSVRTSNQCSRRAAGRRDGRGRSRTPAFPSISPVRAAGLALCGAGPRPGSCRGAEPEGGVHREASGGSHSSHSQAGHAERTDDQRARRASPEGVPGQSGGPFSRWTIGRSYWITSSIAWAKPILPRRIGCWFQNAGG